jgi:hypothetical protein
MDPAGFLEGRSRETTIRRDADGTWSQDGEPLEHPNLTRAFDRWIARAEDGRFCLKNEINWAYITLEGAPYFVRSVRPGAGGEPELLLSSDEAVSLRPQTLRLGPEGALYCDVAPGMVARFDRLAMAQLERWLAEDEDGVYLDAQGVQVRPPYREEPLVPMETT